MQTPNSFRHVYNNVSKVTPWHFRFSVSSDIFKDPYRFGRPVGVFNADCWGVTGQDPSDTRIKVKLAEDPNTAARFPLASAFTSRAACALECDFWKLVLRRKFFLEIPWSHATYEEFISAAEAAQQNPHERLADESKWSHELLDFINNHLSQLHRHRDASKPEIDLDEYERIARETSNWPLRSWVDIVRDLQKDIAALPTLRHLQRLSLHLRHLRSIPVTRTPDRSAPFHQAFVELNTAMNTALFAGQTCDKLINDIEDRRRHLEAALREQISQRPQIL